MNGDFHIASASSRGYVTRRARDIDLAMRRCPTPNDRIPPMRSCADQKSMGEARRKRFSKITMSKLKPIAESRLPKIAKPYLSPSCKGVFGQSAHRTKTFHVKRFGTIESRGRSLFSAAASPLLFPAPVLALLPIGGRKTPLLQLLPLRPCEHKFVLIGAVED